MKICFDEHVSVRIVAILKQIYPDEESLLHVSDILALGIEDEIWVRQFARDGGEAVVAADANMLKRHNEIIAIWESGLRVAVLPSQWAQSKRHLQASHLLYWWPHIVSRFTEGGPRKCWKVPWGWGGATDAIAPVSVDIAAARKKARKASRRT